MGYMSEVAWVFPGDHFYDYLKNNLKLFDETDRISLESFIEDTDAEGEGPAIIMSLDDDSDDFRFWNGVCLIVVRRRKLPARVMADAAEFFNALGIAEMKLKRRQLGIAE